MAGFGRRESMLSNPGVKYRLNQATEFLAALVERLLAAKVPGADLRWSGRSLRLADATCVSKPGSTGTADFIVRLGWNALQLTNPAGRPFLLIGYLHCLPPGSSAHEVNLRAAVGGGAPALA